MPRKTISVVAIILAGALQAGAGPTDAEKCESGKDKVAGKYAQCMLNAQSKFVKGGSLDTTKYNESVVKCDDKYDGKWAKLEEKAAGACPSTGDETDIQDFLDACVVSVEDALAGGALPSDVVLCNSDLTTCQGDLSTTNSDLGTCQGDLSTTNSDLGTCNGNLATCSSDLSTTNADLASCQGDLSTTNADLGSCQGDLSATNADLTACEAEPPGQLGKSGQTICYDAAGAVIACAGTGQDGELQKGIARSFTDNGETITDDNTGLMWEKLDDNDSDPLHDKDTQFTWQQAFDEKIKVLNGDVSGCQASGDPATCCTGAGTGTCTAFAGYSDWRLPNVVELEGLKNFGFFGPSAFSAFDDSCSAACTTATCSCTRSSPYWSSTTRPATATIAWGVYFSHGETGGIGKATNIYVRAVRDAS